MNLQTPQLPLWHADCSSLERLETSDEKHDGRRYIPTQDVLADMPTSEIAKIYLTGMPLGGFKGAYGQRLHVIESFIDSGDIQMNKWALQMSDCCRYPVVLKKREGGLCMSLGRCRHRMCGLCQVYRQKEVTEKVMAIVERWNVVRHLVLTLKSSDDDLGDQVTHLIKSFRRLRQRKMFKEHVTAGVGTIEVTYNMKTGKWHPHLHVMMTGKYWAQKDLSSQWELANGESPICHISIIHDRKNAASYVAKYISKPADVVKWSRTIVQEYAVAMSGRRTMIKFGAACKVILTEREPSEKPKGSLQVASVLAIKRAYNKRMSFACDLFRISVVELPTLAKQIDYSMYKEICDDTKNLINHPAGRLEHLCRTCQTWFEEGGLDQEPLLRQKKKIREPSSQEVMSFLNGCDVKAPYWN